MEETRAPGGQTRGSLATSTTKLCRGLAVRFRTRGYVAVGELEESLVWAKTGYDAISKSAEPRSDDEHRQANPAVDEVEPALRKVPRRLCVVIFPRLRAG